MPKLIQAIIAKASSDVVFLSYWCDKCQLQHHSVNLNNNFSLYTAQQPWGLQAILVTPNGGNNILQAMKSGVTDDLLHHIHKGELLTEVVRLSPIISDLSQATDN
jgi:hypothetical protein